MYFLSYSDLCLGTHFRRRGLLLPLITLINTQALGRIPLDEGLTRRRDLYLTAQTFERQRHSRPRSGSNPQSQQVSGRKPRPPGSVREITSTLTIENLHT